MNIKEILGGCCNSFLDVLYPPRCLSCKKPLLGAKSAFLCLDCAESITFIGDNSCKFCSHVLGKYAKRTTKCNECRNSRRNFTRAIAAIEYNKMAKAIIHAFKFNNSRRIMPIIAQLITDRINYEYSDLNFDYIIPVPLHPTRLRSRGYNQSALLATYIANKKNIPYSSKLLIRTKNTTPQSMLEAGEREENLLGAFSTTTDLNNSKILLIDDVFTTGSTVSECAKTLRTAGASRVYVAVLAR